MKQAKAILNFLSENKKETNPNEVIAETGLILGSGEANRFDRLTWFDYLDKTSRPEFLCSLSNAESRNEWAEQVLRIIQETGFSLLDLFIQRVKEIPDQIFFQDMSKNPPEYWTYGQINRLVRQTAALFYQTIPLNPRVAIYSDNSVQSAITDLACLFYNIYNTPLNTHFKIDNLIPIFDTLGINIAVCDSPERLETLIVLRKRVKKYFDIFTLDQNLVKEAKNIHFIGNSGLLLNLENIDVILNKREIMHISRVCTTMFTSGSTGMPKGVSFSNYNLVSKRFARHAALPGVGNNEVLLSYLPLFHTFGRFLELLGMIYWRGTYTFTGNPSTETLLGLFPIVKPSGFISVPIRWQQIYDSIQENIPIRTGKTKVNDVLRSIVGNKLRWGLSAAGYLDPKVFIFFERNGINLSSGFGMTEATGGITMTPPGLYRKNSTGLLLPGLKAKILDNGELTLSGHYIARYLENKGPGDQIEFPDVTNGEYWLNTGDIFTVSKDGFYEIIDRVKDIYKNNKGQTIAPKTLEKKFEGVPGIKQTYLVGDGRPYNVLLIVPDFASPIVQNAINESSLKEYYHQIVTIANKDMANYERVINFSILSRDFSVEKGELTAKGSFNRKVIHNHYKGLIDSLYQTNHIEIELDGAHVIIPRWFFRDIGILENDILVHGEGISDRRNNKLLHIKSLGNNHFQVGDLIYTIYDNLIDIGRISRQPKLWIGNPEFIDFAPVKEGWDLPLKNFSPQVYRPFELRSGFEPVNFPRLKEVGDSKLGLINELACQAIFCDKEIALKAAKSLGEMLHSVEMRLDYLIKRRMEVLARHHCEEVRVFAYKTLLLAEDDPDFEKMFPAFINSGLSFLTEQSIHDIAAGSFERQHMVALRKRLYYYRVEMKWPTSGVIREQFKIILKLLFNFATNNISYYMPVRSEMASWILHKVEPELSELAQIYFFKLFDNFELWLKERSPKYTLEDIEERIVYETGIHDEEIDKINHLFLDTLFLDQSVILAFEELDFNLLHVIKKGMWISRLMSFHNFRHYRLSINTVYNKHYELHMVVSKENQVDLNFEQLFWLSSLSGHPFGYPTLPVLGCSRLKQGIRTTKYLGELTVWEKIREYSEMDNFIAGNISINTWRKLFIRAFSVFFTTIKNSNFSILPGSISPNNVVIPVMDFRETASIVTLSGMEVYSGPLSVVVQMVKEFYIKSESHYPWIKDRIDLNWIFDACQESFDQKTVLVFFDQLERELINKPFAYDRNLLELLKNYKKKLKYYYKPLSLYNAIERYIDWEKRTHGASAGAIEQTIFELYELYRLHEQPQVIRYALFRETYFRKATHKMRIVFDKLLEKMSLSPDISPLQFIELSDLQSMMKNSDDKAMFSKMVFPKIGEKQKLDILKIKTEAKEQIIIRSKLKDKTGEEFIFREPLEAFEIGQLYQLFYKEDFPLNISKMDKHFIVSDSNERIIGGLCYKILEEKTVVLDGSVISSPLQGRGIGSAMVEDFFIRMASIGIKVIKAHFLLGNYYLKNKFIADKKWGAFVKYL